MPGREETRVETIEGSRHVLSRHREEDYPAEVFCYRPPGWDLIYVGPKAGQSFVALGGEYAESFEGPGGFRIEGFRLSAGDRATVLEVLEPSGGSRWRIDRA
ncbi:MAG: hypothetical protein JNK60_20825 [Acidobacteria bacterium]|nr:hypothetical protein [Acidobacteriota bacterium]